MKSKVYTKLKFMFVKAYKISSSLLIWEDSSFRDYQLYACKLHRCAATATGKFSLRRAGTIEIWFQSYTKISEKLNMRFRHQAVQNKIHKFCSLDFFLSRNETMSRTYFAQIILSFRYTHCSLKKYWSDENGKSNTCLWSRKTLHLMWKCEKIHQRQPFDKTFEKT